MTKNRFKRFAVHLAGAPPHLLDHPDCAVETERYVGLGLAILATGVVSGTATGYAATVAFGSAVIGVVVAVFWGLMIINLERWMSSITSHPPVDGLPIWARVGRRLGTWIKAVPRLLLGFAIAVTAAMSLELRLFKPEIDAKLQEANIEAAVKANSAVELEFAEIAALRQSTESIEKAVEQREQALRESRKAEVDELDGLVGSGIRGDGKSWERKKSIADAEEKALTAFKLEMKSRVDRNNERLAELERQRDQRRERVNRANEQSGGLLARVKALSTIRQANAAVDLTTLCITLLLACLEATPILIKLCMRGPLDALIHRDERLAEIRAAAEVATELGRLADQQAVDEGWRDWVEDRVAGMRDTIDQTEAWMTAQKESRDKVAAEYTKRIREDIERAFRRRPPRPVSYRAAAQADHVKGQTMRDLQDDLRSVADRVGRNANGGAPPATPSNDDPN